jgi:hypothetical protein
MQQGYRPKVSNHSASQTSDLRMFVICKGWSGVWATRAKHTASAPNAPRSTHVAVLSKRGIGICATPSIIGTSAPTATGATLVAVLSKRGIGL